jgi:hypothetical protein
MIPDSLFQQLNNSTIYTEIELVATGPNKFLYNLIIYGI